MNEADTGRHREPPTTGNLPRSVEPGTQSASPTWTERIQLLVPSSAASQVAHQKEVGIRSGAQTQTQALLFELWAS